MSGQIAILVLAFRAPGLLRRTLEFFQGTPFHFFVHVDPKADQAQFDFLADYANATPAQDKFPVFWGGFNMMLAELGLLRQALQVDRFSRFVLISDDSFPLRPPAAIMSALKPETQWIGQAVITNNADFSPRYRNFYSVDSDATNPQHRPVEDRTFNLTLIRELKLMEQLILRGKKPLENLYHGAQWWCLTAPAAQYVLETNDADAHLRDSFKYSLISDESYIQTIIGLSHRFQTRDTPMYFDFSRNPKPYLYTTPEELVPAYKSDKLFVRKVIDNAALLPLFGP